MNEHKKRIWTICLILLICLTGTFCYIFFIRLESPGFGSDEQLFLTCRSGRYGLSWRKQSDRVADGYMVEIYDPEADAKGKPVYSVMFRTEDFVDEGGENCVLFLPAEIKPDRPLTFYVHTVKIFRLFGAKCFRKGRSSLAAEYKQDSLWNGAAEYDVNVEKGELSFVCDREENGAYSLILRSTENGYAENDPEIPVAVSEDSGKVTLRSSFGGDGFEIPVPGETFTFTVFCRRADDRLVLQYEDVKLDREAFLTDQISITAEDDGKNRYTLSWNETKGDGYRVSVYDGELGDWKELKKYASQEERVFETGKLGAGIDYRYKVEALQLPSGEKEGSGEKEITLHTVPCVEYATVWPTQELPVYRDSTGTEQSGTIGVLQAVSVIGEKDGRFFVQTAPGEEEGYIDSDKCMINLPDYMGNLCKYDITNSYCSIYLAHRYAIPAVSGTVIAGYEDVLLSDGTFLVPLLYPVAKKLVSVAETAREQGYVIRIYDSFRPYVATRSIYDRTAAALDYVVPANEFTGVSLEDFQKGSRADVLSLSNMRRAEKITEEENKEKKSKKNKKEETKETTEAKSTVRETTYADVMLNNGAYNLGAFLAAKGSMHNLGIAIDMTLESSDTGEELVMQSGMHDLSVHSVQALNNDNANILKNIMMPEGFSMITSEWWHFQDNEVRDNLNPVSIQNGVSVEGWK
ncbi:MAG: hypothetical protein IJ794_11225, partial [Lachnospiraceae bacterium]|nr:hypothetical protein [Lachnospiraceae bacterium]